MIAVGKPVQPRDKAFPRLNYLRARIGKLQIPHVERVRAAAGFEQTIALSEYAVVAREKVKIRSGNLTERDKPPPLARGFLDDSDLVGREQHYHDNAHEFAQFLDGRAVNRHALVFALVYHDFHARLAVTPHGVRADPRHIVAPADKFLIPRRAHAPPHAREVHRFQQIRLALRVFAGKHVKPGRKIQPERTVVAVIIQRYARYIHALILTHTPRKINENKVKMSYIRAIARVIFLLRKSDIRLRRVISALRAS